MSIAAILKALRIVGKNARNSAAERDGKIQRALDRAETLADQRTGGRYRDQISKARATADAYANRLNQPGSGQDGASADGTRRSPGQPSQR